MIPLSRRLRRNIVWLTLLALVWLLCSGEALAGSLTERVEQFPNWSGKPSVGVSKGDLAYPEWMAGTWRMTSTLTEMVAPLAPAVVTPGFEGNRKFLNEPISAPIRFVSAKVADGRWFGRARELRELREQVVSDRAFNGLSLARAYLGDGWVEAVKVDPDNPNRQVTFLRDSRQLASTVTGRSVESPNADTFLTTEMFQQFFRGVGDATAYLNEVENTTAYHREAAQRDASDPVITADQITAIYLSPRDPDYFKAFNQPVALYRYRLTFEKA
ncbi:MAG: DUF6816 family protein [Cyanobacteria bacterium P01_A01_bin.105]